MHLEIVTPERSLFRGEADHIFFPGSDGAFGVLDNHAPVIATLKAGNVRVKVAAGESEAYDSKENKVVYNAEAGSELVFAISGGVVEVAENKVTLLADQAAS